MADNSSAKGNKMEYFLFVISLAAIINSLVTKKAGINGTNLNLKEHPRLFFLFLSIWFFSLIFAFLGIIKVIDM